MTFQEILTKGNKKFTKEFELVYCNVSGKPYAAYRNKFFLVQLFKEKNDVIRLSICRTEINNKGEWKDNITWDELQEIKNKVGFSESDAVEIYPKEKDLVNIANMRHLWVIKEPLGFGWKRD